MKKKHDEIDNRRRSRRRWLVEAATFAGGRIHIEVSGVGAFSVFDVGGDLLAEEAVKVVAV